MSDSTPLKETGELVNFIVEAALAAYAAKSDDGKIDFTDLPKAMPLLMKSGPAFAGIEDVLAEVKASTPEQRAALLAPIADSIQEYTPEDVDDTIEDTEEILKRLDRIVARYIKKD